MSPLTRAVVHCVRTIAAAAVVLGGAAGTAWADDDGSTPAEHLTLTPAHGGARTAVRVDARCAGGGPRDGTVSSPAFVRPVALHRDARGDATATAVVRSGLRPGRRYVVTANCSPTESLSASFAVTGRRPAGAAHAGYGGAYGPVAHATPSDGGLDAATLALGGGLAAAGLAGYLLARRPTTTTIQGGRR